jgi:ABC-2 type transport system ATP-binding protein
MTQPAIRTEHMTREFGSIRAVDGLTMEVPAGIIFGFLGPNGAGKTTTIRLLLGLIEPTAGCAEVLGFDTGTQAQAIRARAGALLEHDGIYEHLSAADNLEFYACIWHLSESERQARIKTLLGEMGLWDRRDEPAGKWSRGMKQKLALARALIHRPLLLLLDEPMAGLDTPSANAVRDGLAALVAREGVTVFVTTHNFQRSRLVLDG